MLCLSGFEPYSRWVPLNDYLIKVQIDFCKLCNATVISTVTLNSGEKKIKLTTDNNG